MKILESSLLISAPAGRVWDVVSDVSAWPGRLPTVSRLDAVDGTALRLGSRYVVHQPKLKPATWRVVQLDPPFLFAWEARYPGLRLRAEHAVSEELGGGSRVVLRMAFSGLFGGIAARRFRSVTEDYLAQEAAAFKRVAEGP